MTKRYGIGILLCTAVMCAVYYGDYQHLVKEKQLQAEDIGELLTAPVEGGREEKLYRYCLKEYNGYVYVYAAEEMRLYEITTIKVKQLPEKIQKELKKGKYLRDEQELYNFLENYSS